MVRMSKKSTIIAEELRKFDIKLQKSVVTRCNSTLFMIRSILKLSQDDMKTIRNAMPAKTKTQKQNKKDFDLTITEREMLDKLSKVLSLFEWATDQFQSNNVSFSR